MTRVSLPEDITPVASFLWTVRWDLPRGASYRQEVLSFPCVNLAIEDDRYRVHGPGTARFVARLKGSGWVTGVRFTPAGFSAFSRRPMRSLVDRAIEAQKVMGIEPPPVPSSPNEAGDALVSYLRRCGITVTSTMRLVDRLVALVQSTPDITRVESLAKEAGMSVRSLHRLFERSVGVSSKWMVRRARVQDAAERVARGERVDWVGVALQLGYHDQSHLIRDFRAQIGQTPAAYARSCRARR